MAVQGKYASWDSEDSAARTSRRSRFQSLTHSVHGVFAIGLIGGVALVLSAVPVIFTAFPNVTTDQKVTAALGQATIELPENNISILAPRFPIKAGEKLVAVHFKLVSVPKNSPRAYAISDADKLTDAFALRDLFPDVPLMPQDVRYGDAPNEVVSNIPANYRALSISVDSASAVEGWATPGANVDVVLIATHDGVDTSNVLARDVRILSVDRKSSVKTDSTAAIPATITLLLRKEETPRIALAARIGKIVLHLRGWKETDAGGASQLAVKDLYRSRPVQNPAFNKPSIDTWSRPQL